MKVTTFVSILSMAFAATAAPALEDRNGGSSSSCKASTKQVCFKGALNCVVQVLGASCTSGTYCCKTDAPGVSVLACSL